MEETKNTHKTWPNKAQNQRWEPSWQPKKPSAVYKGWWFFFFSFFLKKKDLIHLCCSRLSHQADVNVSSAFKCRLPNVSAHSAHVLASRRAYYHKAGTILLATSSWVMHERHVSGNEHDQQAGRMQRLIKKQLLRQMLHIVCLHPKQTPSVISPWWDVPRSP